MSEAPELFDLYDAAGHALGRAKMNSTLCATTVTRSARRFVTHQ